MVQGLVRWGATVGLAVAVVAAWPAMRAWAQDAAAVAETAEAPADEAAAEVAPPRYAEREDALLRLIGDETRLRRLLARKRAAVEAASPGPEREQAEAELHRAETDLESVRREFEELAGNVDLGPLREPREGSTEWGSELDELLGPAVRELRRVSERPRSIDRLKRRIERADRQTRALAEARAELRRLRGRVKNPAVNAELMRLEETWSREATRAANERDLARRRLARLESQSTGFGEAAQGMAQSFFKKHALNLLLALTSLLATLFIFLGLRALARLMFRRRKGSPRSAGRVVDLLYGLLGTAGAVLVYLQVLYATGDWLLLSLSVVFFVGLAWASRSALPRAWKQVILLLDIGQAREGERVEYGGLPWRIRSLGLVTWLENPELAGRGVRVPIDQALGLVSRPLIEGEPWFPTRTGDWILLGGETHGQITAQTPDLVTFTRPGGETRHLPATEFAAGAPVVLSDGFRVRATTGVAYGLQPEVTQRIPELMADHLRQGLADSEWGEHVLRVAVSFQGAGASSLDLLAEVDLAGAAAPAWPPINRRVAALCVEACTRHGWEIPFDQLDLHLPDGMPAPAPAPAS